MVTHRRVMATQRELQKHAREHTHRGYIAQKHHMTLQVKQQSKKS